MYNQSSKNAISVLVSMEQLGQLNHCSCKKDTLMLLWNKKLYKFNTHLIRDICLFLGEVVAGLQFWDKCCLNVDGVVVEAVV